MKKQIISTFLSIITIAIGLISITISIFALCISAYRPSDLNFDYIGVIVGVLSFLVTIVLGWQIYNYISLRFEMEKIINEKINEATTKTTYAMIGYINSRTGSIWGRSADSTSLDNAFNALKEVKLSKGIPCYNIALDFSINQIIKYIDEIKSNNESLTITKTQKSIYNHILKDIDHEKVGCIIEELKNATGAGITNS